VSGNEATQIESNKQKESKVMAHRIEEMDQQQGIEQAWHGLTKVSPKLSLEENWLTEWDIEPITLHTPDGKPLVTAGNEIEGAHQWQALKCTDNDIFIGKPFNNQTYTPITNKMFLDVIRESLKGTKHSLVSVGSVCNRGRIFASIRLEQLELFKAAGREYEPYLNFGSSHDMSCVYYANTSNICTVCNNTFTMNLFHKGKSVDCRIKHTKGAKAQLENLPAIIDAAVGVQAEFAAAMKEFSKVPCDAGRADRIFTGFTVARSYSLEELKDDPKLVSTRSLNQKERLIQLFGCEEVGNKGRDLSDVFQAGTDYYTHEVGNDQQRQFQSSEFGTGLRRKMELYQTLADEDELQGIESRGRSILELVK
jgi:hypothetical protein